MSHQEEIRQFPKKILIFAVLFVSLIAIGTFGFMIFGRIGFENAILRTFESLAFIFSADSGAEKFLEIFLAIVGVMIVWWILWGLFDMLFQGNLTEYLKIHKYLSRLEKMRNHYIIAGGGRVGEEIAKDLSFRKRDFIIIERDLLTFSKLKKLGYLAIHGDVSDETILKKAGIERARIIVVAMPETEKNLLVTMMARDLNKDIEIYARCDKPVFVSKLKKAGAKIVVVPELVAAEKILSEMR